MLKHSIFSSRDYQTSFCIILLRSTIGNMIIVINLHAERWEGFYLDVSIIDGRIVERK